MSTMLAPRRDPGSPRRRLTIPAHRTEARETLLVAAPFFLRGGADPTPDAPPLLSFAGDGFMEELMAAIADPAKWPRLLPWRDWAEPPAGVLDAAGAARYPADIRRAKPNPLMFEADADVLTDDRVPGGTPAWLRKLYLPLHERFTFVAFDIVCERSGWPRLGRDRVLGAGAVVRRLRANGANATPDWEDWISADGKRGIWVKLARRIETPDPVALPRSTPPPDPEALGGADYAGIESVVRARLGLGATAPLPAALDSSRLTLLPSDAARGEAARHCTLYGYVPVFSSVEQANEFPATGLPSLQAELAAKAAAAIARLADAAPEMAGRLQPDLQLLLGSTVLPDEPSDGDFLGAISLAASYTRQGDPFALNPAEQVNIPGSELLVLLAIDEITAAVLRHGWAALAPAPDLPTTTLLAFSDPGASSDWLEGAITALVQHDTGSKEWLAGSVRSRQQAWTRIVAKRIHQLARAVLAGGTPGPASPGATVQLNSRDGLLLLACAVLRLRRLRLGLVVALRQQMFGTVDPAALRVIRNGVPLVTAGTLGLEIEAAEGLEAWRGTPQTPAWPPLLTDVPAGSGRSDAITAHRAALTLGEAFADVEVAGAEAGSVFEAEQDDRLLDAADALGHHLGLSGTREARMLALRALGLELREQPARGLFALPGPQPDPAALSLLSEQIGGRITALGAAVEARDTGRVHRLRYDHDSLYAVWCWARVAGRDACEKPEVIWTRATEAFSIAEPTDILGARPATIQLPDIPRLIRDIPRMAKAKARPFAAFAAPPNSGYVTGEEAADTKPAWGIGFVCSFAIPVLTICAYILFSIIFSILIVLPGFFWMLLLKFCIPIPVPKKSP